MVCGLLVVLLAFPTIAVAQPKQGKWSIIPKVGVTISKVSGDKIFYLQEGGGGGVSAQESNSKYKAGFLGGVDVQYQVTSVFGVSAGVFYQQQGTRFDDFTMLGADEKGGESVGSQRLHLGYLAVPVMVSGYVAPGLALKAGVQPSWLMNAEHCYETSSFTVDDDGHRTYGTSHDVEADVKSICRSFNLSIPVGISYEYQNVVLDARYTIPLTKTYKDDYGDGRNSTFLFTVGYRIEL